MTPEENYRKLEPSLKSAIGTLGLLGVTEWQQEAILRLVKFDIDRSFQNGQNTAMEHALTEIKTVTQ